MTQASAATAGHPALAKGAAKPIQDVAGYNEQVVRLFVIATIVWGVVAFLLGVVIAFQLAFPSLNWEGFWGLSFNFGRLRPLHTTAAAVAFGGCALMGTSFYIVQRTCRVGLFGGRGLASLMFWSFQLFIVLWAVNCLAGNVQSREYAEPEWYLDLMLTVIWVIYLVIFAGTLMQRREPHIYVANWFFLAFIVTVAILHIVNNLAVPVSLLGAKSYPLFSGVQDAMVQWWYGHNVVGFFLTAGFLGMMYYFIPKRAERPVYSYRLSVIHFWALIFLYIWAGPHHLHYTALPDWAQTLGMVFSVMLWMPSWGGMINGIMTLSGAWEKLRTDPVLRFMVVAVAFYGMSTFEGPLMSIKAVNALSHYTDWTIGHVHSGALGWVAFVAFGALYHLVPLLWKKRALFSDKLVEWHFWISSGGIVLYITSMWFAGITQGLMWRAYDDQGTLVYSFTDTVTMLNPFYIVRALGGLMFFVGALIMVYNLVKTMTMREETESRPASPNAAQAVPAE